jgi:quercetin dioxygenase-like cupin family protein
MNILENIQFATDKPTVAIIKKNEKIKYFAVALGKNAVLQKHKTNVPTTLLVQKGELDFRFEDRNYHLKTLDSFEIPVDEVHEVIGLQNENLFTLIQEL